MGTNEVCGEFPKYCYRSFDCKEYAEDFIDRGTFRMGCQLSYKAIENKSRRDSTEGTGSIREPGIVSSYGFSSDPTEEPICLQKMGFRNHTSESSNPRFCFCTSLPDVDINHMKSNLGKYIVRINDPKQLAEDINNYFIGIGEKILIEGINISYNKGQESDCKLSENEIVGLSYKQKPESFIADCEFRIVAFKLGEVCKGDCKFIGEELDQDNPKCEYEIVNLQKKMEYTEFCES